MAAQVIRFSAFVFLLVGAVAQIYTSSIESSTVRLHYSQGSLALLAIAALFLQCDRAFGWTSGWTRYITTAMMMESLFRDFKLKWAKYQISRPQPLTREDIATLFELASTLEGQLLKARAEETAAWATEFHAGLALLESAIKSQRETTEKKLDELRASVDKEDVADKNARKSGAVEVTLKFKADPKRVSIAWDDSAPEEKLTTSWTRLSVTPGQHRIDVTVLGDTPVTTSKIVDVTPGATTRVELQLNA